MTTPQTPPPPPRAASERGFSLLETLVALGLLVVVAAGVLPLGVLAVKATENEGHLRARTTEYAQDKLEQLLALSYGDSTSDTTVFPAVNTGGTGLAIGGSIVAANPVDGYVDYLDIDGAPLGGGATAPAGWYYKRVWQVSLPRANLKQISVTTIVATAAAGGAGDMPQSTVSALKTFPF